MQDYQLEELSPRAFEQFTVAAAMAQMAVTLEVYGSGRDGGREATHSGTLTPAQTGASQTWTGYTVVQAKQKEHLSEPDDNLKWLKAQLNSEITSWMEKDRETFPNNLLIVTNVRLSAAKGVDEIRSFAYDLVRKNFGSDARPVTPGRRGLRYIHVWHRDTLNGVISKEGRLRDAFPILLTAGDILTRIGGMQGQLSSTQIGQALREHGASALRNERWIRFGEIGANDRQSVEQVVVDLPATNVEKARLRTISAVVSHGDAVLRKTTRLEGEKPHFVLTGAPGNGKSTLSTFLTQVYRMEFMRGEPLAADLAALTAETRAATSRLQQPTPMSQRWPLRIDLAEMANTLGPSGGPNLRRYMADRVTDRALITVQPATLKTWLLRWPALVIFDGLDEVTSPALRRRVLDEVSEFVEESEADNADLMIILTTRPTGYTERFMPHLFQQLDLDHLSATEAVAYGMHVTHRRLRDDDVQRDRVIERFRATAKEPNLERLLNTPLQVLILLIIIETLGELPANRYDLFNGYFETMYLRETQKATTFQNLLRLHKDDISSIHERVGLTLQTQCEGRDDMQARLPLAALREIARDRLTEVGYDAAGEAEELAAQFEAIAMQRLVLLVADESDSVSFEVRSLQELMAARALAGGPDTAVGTALETIAPSPHWRNTWLFAAGRLFTEGDHRRELVLELVEGIDDRHPSWPGWLVPIGPELSAQILDDGMAATKPHALRRMVTVLLRSLDGPMPINVRAVADGITAVKDEVKLRLKIRKALEDAFAGTPEATAIASSLAWYAEVGSRIPGQPADLARLAESRSESGSRGRRTTLAEPLRNSLVELGDGYVPASVGAFIDSLELLTVHMRPDGSVTSDDSFACDADSFLTASQDAEAREVLDLILHAPGPSAWSVRSTVSRVVWNALSRRPVGGQLDFDYLGIDEIPF